MNQISIDRTAVVEYRTRYGEMKTIAVTAMGEPEELIDRVIELVPWRAKPCRIGCWVGQPENRPDDYDLREITR